MKSLNLRIRIKYLKLLDNVLGILGSFNGMSRVVLVGTLIVSLNPPSPLPLYIAVLLGRVNGDLSIKPGRTLSLCAVDPER